MSNGPLGQDEIDRLLAELGAEGGPSQPPAAPPAADAPLPEAEIARLMGELAPQTRRHDATAAPAASSTSSASRTATPLATAASTAPAAPPPAPAAAPAGPLGQDEIDRLLAELGAEPPAQTAAGSASRTATPPAAAASTAPAAPPPAAAAAPAGPLGQDEIDRLLAELGAESPASTAGPATGGSPSSVPAGTAARAAAPPATAPPAPAPAAAAPAPEGPLTQDDIDRLLAELGVQVPSAPAKPAPTAPAQPPAPSAPSRPTRVVPPAPPPVEASARPSQTTQQLTPEEIDAIVAKQSAAAAPGTESEAAIDQAEIDKLVKQLAQATGAPEAEEVAQAIVGKAADIERLQAEASAQPPVAPAPTNDAVDVASVLAPSGTTTGARQPAGPPVATISMLEWRAARWLLVAAVLLLGMCAGALIVLTLAVGGLTRELQQARAVERPAADGYADRVRLALAQLQAGDEVERARGVRWLEDLKQQYPERAPETALVLARYFREREAWKRASEEYAQALSLAAGDPRLRLEYAECLMRQGDDAIALRQVYAILAEEARWLAERDAEGRPVPDVERNRRVVADAYLLLGRLLAAPMLAKSEGRP